MTRAKKTTHKTNKAMELTQDTAKATLKAGVKTAELAEDYVQGIYKAGYDANYQGLRVAKNYWDTTSTIRQDWLKLFAKTGDHFINAAAKVEMPDVNDAVDFGKGVFTNVTKTVGDLTKQAK